MEIRNLGKSGLRVSAVGLGCNNFGGRIDLEATRKVVHKAIDLGITLFDTADVYGNQGGSESLMGEVLGPRRKDIVLATKFAMPMDAAEVLKGASRRYIMTAVEASLKRLKTDWIDLYQLHQPDPRTPIEETLRALDDLVRQGHVRYVGVSNWQAWTMMKALGVAERNGWARLASLQAYYTIAGRDLEREIASFLTAEKVGLMVWSPLAGGLLSGKYDRDGSGPQGSRRVSFDFPPIDKGRAFDCIDAMRPMAEARDVSVARIALAFVLSRPFVTSVIIGARSPEQLDDNLAAVDITLDAAEIAALEAVSALPPEYPGWMLARQAATRTPVA